MATILRNWSYRYRWLYDTIANVTALAVGGEKRFRLLPLQGIEIDRDTIALDLCCGSGQATKYLVECCDRVIGLDASPYAIDRAQQQVPEAEYVEAFAQAMPFEDDRFDLVHTSAALHEMQPQVLDKILAEVHRVLKPGGTFVLIDFHAPTNPIFWPGLALFLWLFETETAWQLIDIDLAAKLEATGFEVTKQTLHAGGSLQAIACRCAPIQN